MAAGGHKLVLLRRGGLGKALGSALVLVSCGTTDHSGSKPSEAGSSAAGDASAGTPSMAGSSNTGGSSGAGGSTSTAGSTSMAGSSSGDVIDEFLGNLTIVCDQIDSCYPELQEPDSDVCTAPASDDRKVIYPRGIPGDLTTLEQCLRSFSDQTALFAYLRCQLDAAKSNAACHAPCPESAEACATTGNEAVMACRDGFDGSAELNDCYMASQ